MIGQALKFLDVFECFFKNGNVLGVFMDVDEGIVQEQIRQSAARGVSGVPFFIINNEYGISGAQPAATFVEMFDQMAASGP